MNLFNINVPKDSISMIFDSHYNVENYYTTLFLHKSKITLAEENNPICYIYESSSHFALAFLALSDLIQNSKRNIRTWQNCGRYYL